MNSHDCAAGEVQNGTNQSPANEKRSATKTVDERQYETSSDKEDDILDNGRRKSGVSSHASHSEDVNEVVKHDISSPGSRVSTKQEPRIRDVNLQQLLPDLDADTNNGTLPDTGREKA